MSGEPWSTLTSRETVLVPAAPAVHCGGVVGLARNLPGPLERDA
ncbi:hypothetical protein [Streptomyces sp. NPDC002851]